MMRYAASLGGLFGALAVVFGAFGAHALEGRLTSQAEEWYRTAVMYQLIHALALVLAGTRAADGTRSSGAAAVFFLLGIGLFCGSLYVLAMTGLRHTVVVLATPAGGLSFILAWIFLAISLLPKRT